MNFAMSLPVAPITDCDGQVLDQPYLEFALPSETSAYMVAVFSKCRSRYDTPVALFYGTFGSPEDAEEWGGRNVHTPDNHWTVVPLSAVYAPKTALDKLREAILTEGGGWTTERAACLLGIKSIEAWSLLNHLATEEGILISHGDDSLFWTPTAYLTALRDTIREHPGDETWDLNRVSAFFNENAFLPGLLTEIGAYALVSRLVEEGFLMQLGRRSAWARNPVTATR